ncbi:hypothetical protein FYJ33_15640 [Clostridiaceae bacterium WCA-383-APC-5B]|uniref:Uncharacterized protein n=2 Tax=Inconstantimicrobium porci TaxID=2652291 RepID=A0A7X2N0Z9_9CLOT|nr:hypothetical protein [Inconstantimicrobium porci]
MKKVVGIISIVLFAIVEFQSCAAGIGNAIQNSKEASGSAGLILGFAMLIAGILSLVSKQNKGIVITAIVFYVIGAIIGFANIGTFKDLMIWSVISLIFAVLLLLHLLKNKSMYSK